MSKRIVVSLMIVMFVFGGVFKAVEAQATNMSQLIELFISLGIIPSDKAAAARAAVTSVTVPTTAPTTAPATGVTGSTVSAQTAASFVDFKINGFDSAAVPRGVTVKASWVATSTQTSVRYCVGTGSAFAVSGGGTWGSNGVNGLLPTTGEANIIFSTVSTAGSVLNIGIQCTLSNGTTVTDNVPVTITNGVVLAPVTNVVPTTTVAPATTVTAPVVAAPTISSLTWNIFDPATWPTITTTSTLTPTQSIRAKVLPAGTVHLYNWNKGFSSGKITNPGSAGSYQISMYVYDQATASILAERIVNVVVTNNMAVTSPTAGLRFTTGSNIDVAFTNPVYQAQYKISLRGRAYEYVLSQVTINEGTDQKKISLRLPSSVPVDTTQYNIVIINSSGVDVASSGSFYITNQTTPTTSPTAVTAPTISRTTWDVNDSNSWPTITTSTLTNTQSIRAKVLPAGTVHLYNWNYGVSSGRITNPGSAGSYKVSIYVYDYSIASIVANSERIVDVVVTNNLAPVAVPTTTTVTAPTISSLTWDANNSNTWPTITTTSTLTGSQSMRAKLVPDGTIHLIGENRADNYEKIVRPGAAGRYQLSLYVYDYSTASIVAERIVDVVITNSAAVGTTAMSCAGSEPTGVGLLKGTNIYAVGHGTTQWTFVTGTPSSCQWTCQSGYGLSGNSCAVAGTVTPTYPTYQLCGGTEPSSSVATKGSGSYSTGYGTTQWTFVAGTPGACQYVCASGATWNGYMCAVPVVVPASAPVVAPDISTNWWYVEDTSSWPTISTPTTLTPTQSIRAKVLPGGDIHLYTRNNGVNSGKITTPGVAAPAGTYQLSIYIYDYSTGTIIAERVRDIDIRSIPVAASNPVGFGTNSINYESVPATVVAGSTFSVTIKNTGTKIWGGNHQLGLSTANLAVNHQFVSISDTASGQTRTVTFTAPTNPGTYLVRAVEQGVEWFGGTGNQVFEITAASSINSNTSNLGSAFSGFDAIFNLIRSLVK